MSTSLPEWLESAANHPDEVPGLPELIASLADTGDPSAKYTTEVRATHSRTHGFAQKVPGLLRVTTHELQSKNERKVLFHYEWEGNVVNIREGFTLPLTLTQWLAPRLGIKRHPWNRFKNCNASMSVDFIMTLLDGSHHAIDVKEEADQKRKRVDDKLRLAATALALAGVPHEVVGENFVTPVFVRNCRFLRIHALGFDPAPVSEADLPVVRAAMEPLLRGGTATIRTAALRVHRTTQLPIPNLIRTAFYLIGRREWSVNMNRPINPDTTLTFNPSNN